MSKITNVIGSFLLLLGCMISFSSFAATRSAPISPEKAFVFSANVISANEIQAQWKIAPGHFLYMNKIHITVTPDAKAEVKLPPAQHKAMHDEDYQIYTEQLTVPVVLNAAAEKIKLSVEYQGCSEAGVCYPPVHKNVELTLPAQVTGAAAATTAAVSSSESLHTLLTNQNGVQELLKSQHIAVLLLIFAGLGLLLAFTPCVLPMIPILTGIIVGQKGTVSAKRAFVLSLIYVVGSAVTYALAGVAAASMGHSLQVWFEKPWIIVAASGLFVVLALSLFGYYELRLPNGIQNRLNNFSNKQQGGTYFGVFLMGAMSALIVSPCVTAPLVGVLMYIAQTGDRLLGASALFAMGMGMGIPLLLIGMSAGKWLPKSGSWMDAVKYFFGIFMLAMAVWMLSRVAPHTLVMILWSALLLGSALFIAMHLPKLIGRHTFNRIFGSAVGCSAMFVLFLGVGSPTLVNKVMHNQEIKEASSNFVLIHNIADLNKQLAVAQRSHQPVILDFYADWCESCVSMDKHVFSTPDVRSKLSNYVMLRADLTEADETIEALLKEYGVIAPPTVLFFDPQGREMNAHRIVGEVDAQEFMSRVDTIWSKVALKQ